MNVRRVQPIPGEWRRVSRFTFSDLACKTRDLTLNPTQPHRPIKPIYVKKFVDLVDGT